eukprot:TRINITY_DN104632_c0_g1_i1.p1 TRINITY_DN104632_c0_g1~~TRINITY_DN104632_c0_g1_i1.p1  ORF type:complete len:372 (-),score=53.90 TRINITY_DN104632_c0_g1_i1:163-1278(-)
MPAASSISVVPVFSKSDAVVQSGEHIIMSSPGDVSKSSHAMSHTNTTNSHSLSRSLQTDSKQSPHFSFVSTLPETGGQVLPGAHDHVIRPLLREPAWQLWYWLVVGGLITAGALLFDVSMSDVGHPFLVFYALVLEGAAVGIGLVCLLGLLGHDQLAVMVMTTVHFVFGFLTCVVGVVTMRKGNGLGPDGWPALLILLPEGVQLMLWAWVWRWQPALYLPGTVFMVFYSVCKAVVYLFVESAVEPIVIADHQLAWFDFGLMQCLLAVYFLGLSSSCYWLLCRAQSRSRPTGSAVSQVVQRQLQEAQLQELQLQEIQRQEMTELQELQELQEIQAAKWKPRDSAQEKAALSAVDEEWPDQVEDTIVVDCNTR